MMISTARVAFCTALAASLGLLAAPAAAHRPAGRPGHTGPVEAPFAAAPAVTSGVWIALTHAFPGATPGTALQLTDGTVIMHDECTSNWYRLTPSAAGSYAAGAWRLMAAMPGGYSPLYFASSVLPDGRLMVNGGEYDGAGCLPKFTGAGALYFPSTNVWKAVSRPASYTGGVGDADSVILPNGDYMLQNVVSGDPEAIAHVAPQPGFTVSWSSTGTGKADGNDEEGWTLLANGNVLTVDVGKGSGAKSPAEIYSQTTGAWTSAGTAPNILVDPAAVEIGPAVRLPSGAVFQVGANSCGKATCAGHTAIYSATGHWTAGPDLPKISGGFYDSTDGPAAILPDGNVLVQASPAYACLDPNTHKPSPYCSPSHFFEYDGTSLTRVNEPSTAPTDASFEGRMLVLPTGQILWSDTYGGNVEIYTPKGSPNASWRPTITTVPATLARGHGNNALTGTRLHGVSNGAAYGDDVQTASNYPLVRITNTATGHMCFAYVHDHTTTHTLFDMPSATSPAWMLQCATGAGKLQVIVNGIASTAVAVTVQ